MEEEVVTHVIGKKALLGKVWKDTDSGDYVRYRCYSYGIEYKIGDPVFIESQRPEDPFHICLIQVSYLKQEPRHHKLILRNGLVNLYILSGILYLKLALAPVN